MNIQYCHLVLTRLLYHDICTIKISIVLEIPEVKVDINVHIKTVTKITKNVLILLYELFFCNTILANKNSPIPKIKIPKKLLIDYSLEKNIKLISSMGTANKIDPTKLQITDIRKTSYDPLAKILRKYVNDLKTNKKIMVVSSTEQPLKKEILTSLVFVPATAGLLCANYVINDIIEL